MSNNKEIINQILSKIKEYDQIIITRHIRPDGDAIGSSRGLCEILRATYPQKKIYVQANDSSDYLSFLGPDDDPIDPSIYKESLLIVTDTATLERMSNSYFDIAKETIKIDHHIENSPYGTLRWVEDERSSTCEMITYFYQTFKDELKLPQIAAKYLFIGMVTDSGRFRFDTTTGETLRLAATLIDTGLDTEDIYSRLYLEDFDKLKFKSYVYEKIQMTPNGLVYIYVDDDMKKKFNLTNESAGDSVNFLKGIKNCIAQIAFIHLDDGTIRVRLRSRFMPINTLAEKYNGGGHKFSSGATLNDESQIKLVVDDGDKMVAEYKANNDGWL